MSAAPPVLATRLGIRRELRLGLVLLAVLMALLLVWGLLAPVSGAVVAHGTLRPMAQRVSVLAGSAGVLGEWQLDEGRAVRQGEPLARIDDPDTLGQRDAVTEAETAERLRVARLRLLAGWAPGAPAPATLPGVPQAPERLLADELHLLHSSWRAQQAAIDQIEQQLREARRRVEALERASQADREAMRLAAEELSRNEALVHDGFVSATRLLSLQRAVQEAQSRLAAEQGALGEAGDRLAELTGQQRNEPLRLARDNARELAEAERRLADLGLRRRVAQARSDSLQVRAPADGRLVDVRPLAVGSVVAAGQALADLLPAGGALRVQARLRPEDLAEVRTGAQAEVQITAFPSRDTPPLQATVLLVGADRSTHPDAPASLSATEAARGGAAPGFSVWLELAPTALPLVAGMEAEVFITTRPRSPLDYWLSPLGRLWRQALRER